MKNFSTKTAKRLLRSYLINAAMADMVQLLPTLDAWALKEGLPISGERLLKTYISKCVRFEEWYELHRLFKRNEEVKGILNEICPYNEAFEMKQVASRMLH